MVNVRTLDTMHTYMRKYYPMHASLADIVADIAANSIEAGAELIKVDISENDDFIVLKVVDNGKGMDKHTQRRIFQAGFTTKKRGWGLGLTLSKRIIEEYHRGKLFVKSSKPGVGTTFRIVLKKTENG